MTLNEIVQLIQSVGFPIAITIYLLYNSRHESERNRAVIDNNTEALNALHLQLVKDDII